MDCLARTHRVLSGRRFVHGNHPSICDHDPSLPSYVSITGHYGSIWPCVVVLCCGIVSICPSVAGQEARETHPIPLIDSTSRSLSTVLVVLDGGHASTRDSEHLFYPSASKPVSQPAPAQAHSNDDPIGDQGLEGDRHRGGSIGLDGWVSI